MPNLDQTSNPRSPVKIANCTSERTEPVSRSAPYFHAQCRSTRVDAAHSRPMAVRELGYQLNTALSGVAEKASNLPRLCEK